MTERIMAEFIAGIARMAKDGECVACLEDGNTPSLGCAAHTPWDMPNDDAVDTLHSLISEARKLTAEFQAHAAEQEGLECYRTAADNEWGREGEIEIDPGALVSVSDDGGAYVAGWLWVSDEEAGVNREAEEEEE